MRNAVPDRWLNYTPIGIKIKGTRFIAFKVPLRQQANESVDKDSQLTCDILLNKIPNLGMVIDLTNTNRYYNPYFFLEHGIRYEKLMIPGRMIPPRDAVCAFKTIVRSFLKDNAHNGKLIGVHCTHGVNRTGYLICNFMISEMKMSARHAIDNFQTARGHRIERENYISQLFATRRPSVRHSYSNYV